MPNSLKLTCKGDPYTKALLHFDDDSDPFKDECGNSWTAVGNPTISSENAKFGKALQLDGSSYLSLDNGITLGGQDFTIDGFCQLSSISTGWACIFDAASDIGLTSNRCLIGFRDGLPCLYTAADNNISFSTDFRGQLVHFAGVYQHNKNLWTSYINGVTQGSLSCTIPRITRTYARLGVSVYTNELPHPFIGIIDEFRISDGIARWTGDSFTPPTEPYSLSKDYLVTENIKLYSVKPNPPALALATGDDTVFAPIVPLQVEDIAHLEPYTRMLMHFDESNSKDELGHYFQEVTKTTISDKNAKFGNALQLGYSNLAMYANDDNLISLFGADMTIDFWACLYSFSSGGLFSLIYEYWPLFELTLDETNNGIKFYYLANDSQAIGSGFSGETIPVELDKLFHFALIYSYSSDTFRIFIDGQLKQTLTDIPKYTRRDFWIRFGNTNHNSGNLNGTIDEFRISDGIARWTSDSFTPPTEPYSAFGTIANPLASHFLIRHKGEDLAVAISKKTHNLSLSGIENIILTTKNLSATVTATYVGDGFLSAASSNSNLATVKVSGKNVTITAVGIGDVTITVKASETADYELASKSFVVSCNVYPALNECTPEQIQTVVRKGIADKVWNVGDMTSAIPIAKTKLGEYSLNTANNFSYINAGNYYAKILDFNHNSALETDDKYSIHFALGSTSGGTDIAFVESTVYSKTYASSISSLPRFAHKRANTASNAGGWNGSYIRTFLNNTLLENIDSSWTAVMSSVNKYTDNTGKQSTAESAVTATTDKLFIPSLYEIWGSVRGNNRDADRCNPYEATKQTQYSYYKNGANKTRYKHNSTSTSCRWWSRSPSLLNTTAFCDTTTNASDGTPAANYSGGVVPCFVIS